MPYIQDSRQQEIDTEVEYILQLESKLERDFTRSQLQEEFTQSQDIEVDSICDCFGTIFRVWRSQSVIGIFYQAVSGNGWIAESFQLNRRPQWCASDEEAQNLIRLAR